MKKLLIIIILYSINLQINNAQTDIPFQYQNLSFEEYIELVKAHNLGYAAEKLNINISEAAIEAAKIFQDPSFSVDMTEDMEQKRRTGYGFSSELVKTIDLGGKRKARIDLTRSEKELATSLLADFFRNLLADATLVYLEGMKQKQLFMVRYDSYEMMKRLYEADSIRLKLGSIMEIDAIQSKLEAGILLNDLTHSMSEWKNSLYQISFMTGRAGNDTVYLPSDHLHDLSRNFLLDSLITEALNNRADLQAALMNKEVAKKELRLVKKERNTDPDLKLGYSNYFLNDGASPKSTGLTAGIAIPLKFSNFYKGDIKMAEIKVQQAEELYKQAELKIRTEIVQAWELYQDYTKQVQNFNNGLLEKAENVRKGKIYSYQRGETSLLEVLNAQRTYDDIQTTYYETRFNHAASLVGLEQAAGIWDIYLK